jgi:hypothetical protein
MDDETPDTPAEDVPAEDAPLGESGEKALKAERERARRLEREHKAAVAELAKLRDAGKSEHEKALEKAKTAEERASKAEAHALRLEVAFEKGLTASQARRLVGATREELEADAEDLLTSFGKASDEAPKGPPSRTPKEKMRSATPPEDEPDPDDTVAAILKAKRGG